MRTPVFVVLVMTLGACSIFEPQPSDPGRNNEPSDVANDPGETRDMALDVTVTSDMESDSSSDASIDLNLADMSPDMVVGCEPACGANERCVDSSCLLVNGEGCTIDAQCVGFCTNGACSPPRAMWVWSFATILDDNRKATLFSFAQNKQVRALYLESEALIYEADPNAGVTQATLSQFIGEANALGIDVYLLFGFAGWALPANHAEVAQLIGLADAYASNESYEPPAGIVVDIEPHTLPEWQTEQESLASSLVDVLEQLMVARSSSELPLLATIPFWYDTVPVLRGNETKPLHEWVLDTTSGITLMDYRDEAVGVDGLIELATAELAYADDVGKSVVLNVETTCGLLDKTTFCEEGEQAMEAELLVLIQSVPDLSFTGLGIHEYVAYSLLPP